MASFLGGFLSAIVTLSGWQEPHTGIGDTLIYPYCAESFNNQPDICYGNIGLVVKDLGTPCCIKLVFTHSYPSYVSGSLERLDEGTYTIDLHRRRPEVLTHRLRKVGQKTTGVSWFIVRVGV
jgi:hypothetical protein